MARRARLIALVLAVLAAHGAALDWISRHWLAADTLRPMTAPLLTRLITPNTPAPPVAPPRIKPKVPVAQARRPPSAMVSIAPQATATVATTTTTTPGTPSEALPPAAPEGTATPPPAPPSERPSPLPAPEATPQPPAEPAVAAREPAVPEAPTPPADVSPPTDPLASWPADTRLSYQLRGWFRGELYGDARVQWQREAERYQVRIEIDIGPFASLAMTSQGVARPDSLHPDAYEETRRGKSRVVRLGEQQLSLEGGRRLPRPAGVQDTASQFVDLSHRFASGLEPLEVGRAISFWMARPGGLDLWTYDITEQVTLQTPQLGPVQAFHLVPRPTAQPRGNITAEMWFAPSLQYLPVRIRINQGKEIWLDLLVEKIEQR
ncbi:MAG: DUF3108 domain-containing protein [Ramlibacter sp.]|nr:DUF3108 domain-containing protein [Ramlibacter sp.]